MAMIFMDGFERIDPCEMADKWPSVPRDQPHDDGAPIVIEGPTWHYVGRGGIVITRTEFGHRIDPMPSRS